MKMIKRIVVVVVYKTIKIIISFLKLARAMKKK